VRCALSMATARGGRVGRAGGEPVGGGDGSAAARHRADAVAGCRPPWELADALRAIVTTDQPAVAASAFETLRERLQACDPSAFGDREDWWPQVLDDIRDTAGAENYAAFEYVDAEHGKRIVTQAGAIAAHPEERLWDRLQAAGVGPEQVLRIHTDLQPCFMPGHYCSMWLAEAFPHVEMTHTFPYGESADSREEGIRLLRENAGAAGDGRAAQQ
jgi:nucleic acid/nucleotide deaminase of polymorphic system toxin